jgi:hypothetical protein
VIGDLNGDLELDIVESSYESKVTVLLGLGNLSFKPPAYYDVGTMPYSVSLGDIDGDGALDIATANAGDDSISLLRNLGDGSFVPFATIDTGNDLSRARFADLDGDGDDDLLATIGGVPRGIIPYFNDGAGAFTPGPVYPTPSKPFGLEIADIDGDGDTDALTVNGDDLFSLFKNYGDGSFATHDTHSYPYKTTVVDFGDVDGDGDVDILVLGIFQNIFWLNNGEGKFGQGVSDFLAGNTPNDFGVGDFNDDGWTDVIVSNGFNNTSLRVAINDGRFDYTSFDIPIAGKPRDVVVADLNHDGALDLALSMGGSLITLIPGQCIPCYADFNDDYTPNILDFVAFQLAFVANDPKADCDHNGSFTILDFICFQAYFTVGCK